jgi:SAM-dependent methyltransferase
MSSGNILDAYVRSAPSPQNATDIFKGEWASQFPAALGVPVQAGGIPLFEDGRMIWAINELGGIQNFRTLELGPLEGGHSYMLELHGAASVLAIEANTRAYLKCLIAKELLDMKRVKYLCGDFVEYLKVAADQFDLIVSSGVLYHMRNPVELIGLLAGHTDRIFMWTHYYDDDRIKSDPNLRHKFPSKNLAEVQGFKHILYRQEYQVSLDVAGFCGGNESHSNWLSRTDLLNCLSHFKFKDVRIAHEQPDHPHGPCFSIVATK